MTLTRQYARVQEQLEAMRLENQSLRRQLEQAHGHARTHQPYPVSVPPQPPQPNGQRASTLLPPPRTPRSSPPGRDRINEDGDPVDPSEQQRRLAEERATPPTTGDSPETKRLKGSAAPGPNVS